MTGSKLADNSADNLKLVDIWVGLLNVILNRLVLIFSTKYGHDRSAFQSFNLIGWVKVY